MNDKYQIKETINAQLEHSKLRDNARLLESSAAVPTNTLDVYNRPTGVSMTDSKALPTVIFGLLIIAILIALIVGLF